VDAKLEIDTIAVLAACTTLRVRGALAVGSLKSQSPEDVAGWIRAMVSASVRREVVRELRALGWKREHVSRKAKWGGIDG